MTMYKWNRKNEIKEKKTQETNLQKWKKKIVETTTTIRHIFQLYLTIACMGMGMLPIHFFTQNSPKKLQQ